MNWQDHFRAAMERHRWRQADIAQKSGVNANEISRWLRGDHDPSIISAIRLADAMELSLDVLFRGQIPDDEIEAVLAEAVYKTRAIRQRDSQEASIGTRPGA